MSVIGLNVSSSFHFDLEGGLVQQERCISAKENCFSKETILK
jgi:hypothetical protein